jgi:hypothetical protein
MHTTTTELNTRNFNKLSDRIIDALYALNPEVQDLYDIHINFIDEAWRVDFVPFAGNVPLIKVSAYTEYNDRNQEILKITPNLLTELPGELKLKDEDRSYDLCMNYVTIFEFIISLYDFEYVLN